MYIVHTHLYVHIYIYIYVKTVLLGLGEYVCFIVTLLGCCPHVKCIFIRFSYLQTYVCMYVHMRMYIHMYGDCNSCFARNYPHLYVCSPPWCAFPRQIFRLVFIFSACVWVHVNSEYYWGFNFQVSVTPTSFFFFLRTSVYVCIDIIHLWLVSYFFSATETVSHAAPHSIYVYICMYIHTMSLYDLPLNTTNIEHKKFTLAKKYTIHTYVCTYMIRDIFHTGSWFAIWRRNKSTHHRHKYGLCCLVGHADTWLDVVHQCRHFHVTLNTTGEWKHSRWALSIYTYACMYVWMFTKRQKLRRCHRRYWWYYCYCCGLLLSRCCYSFYTLFPYKGWLHCATQKSKQMETQSVFISDFYIHMYVYIFMVTLLTL